MKLPKIDHGGNVESLGRHDINAPVRVAQAKGNVVKAQKDVVLTKMRGSNDYFQGLTRANTIGANSIKARDQRIHSKTMSDINYKSRVRNNWLNFAGSAVSYAGHMERSLNQKAVAEGAEHLSAYKTAENDIRTGLTRDPFRIEDGKVKSNGDIITDSYKDQVKAMRDDLLEGVDNQRTKDFLIAKFDALEVQTGASVGKTAYGWTMANNQVIFNKSLMEAIDQGDIQGATDFLAAGADNGLVNPADLPKFQNAIEAANSMNIFSSQAEKIGSVGDIVAMRESLASKEIYGSLNKDQMSILSSNLDARLEDYHIGRIENIAKTQGLDAAKAEIRRLTSEDPLTMGYIGQKDQATMIGSMKTAVNNVGFGLKEKKAGVSNAISNSQIMSGKPISQSDTGDVKAYNAAFEGELGKYEVMPEPFSPEWTDAVSRVSAAHTFFPSIVKTEVSRWTASSDPAVVAKAADFYSAAKEYNPMAAQNMKLTKKEKLFLNRVDGLVGPSEQKIKEIRDGIFNLDEVTIRDRNTEFSAEYTDDIDGYFEDQIDGDARADPFWKSAATYGAPVREKYKNLVQHNFMMSGDIESAATEAYAEIMSTHSLSNRSGGLQIVGQDQPESLYGDKYGLDWYGQEVESVLDQAGYYETFYVSNLPDHPEKRPTLTAEEVQLFPAGKDKNGNKAWMMMNNGKFLQDKDGYEIFISFDWAESKAGKAAMRATEKKDQARRLRVERDMQYKRETRMPPPGGDIWAKQPGNVSWHDYMDEELPQEEKQLKSIDALIGGG